MKIPLKYTLRGLVQRKTSTIMTSISFAMVVATLMATLAMVKGIEDTLLSSGSADRFFAISSKTTSESQSRMEDNDPFVLDGYDEIKINVDGLPLTSHEIVTTASVGNQMNDLFRQIIRGVDLEQAKIVHNNIHIIEGRYFSDTCKNEIILGKGAFNSLNLKVGQQIKMQKQTWAVVGVFEDNGSPMESEIWTSRENIELSFKKKYISSVWGIVKDKSQTNKFVERLNNEALLVVYALTEREYFSKGANTAILYKFIGWFVAILLSIGAVFSAMNTMYASIASRKIEIGTLRAIGFKKPSIALALLVESLLISLSGCLLACMVIFLFDGYTMSTNVPSIGKILYQVNISGTILFTGIVFSVFLGLVSGTVPAKNTLKIDIIESLRN